MSGNNGYDFNIICLSCDRDDCPGECERIRKKAAQARQAPGAARRGRKAKRHECNGASRTLAEWAEVTGIREITLRLRLYLGWPIERALTEPVHDRGQQRRGTVSARKGPMPQARGVKE